jgi:hypothetical protein
LGDCLILFVFVQGHMGQQCRFVPGRKKKESEKEDPGMLALKIFLRQVDQLIPACLLSDAP